MSPDQQLQVVRKHYALNAAGDFSAAEHLLTADFSITIPPFQPFGGVYRGKTAFQELLASPPRSGCAGSRRSRPPWETDTRVDDVRKLDGLDA